MENIETLQRETLNFFNGIEDLLVLKNSQIGFRIYYQNCNGLKTKLNEFRGNLGRENYDAIVLTETNLQSDNEYSSLLESKGYRVFEKHRSTETSSKKSGGGVLVAVLNKYSPYRRFKWELANLEFVAVSLIIKGKKSKRLNLFGTYIPPASKLSVYEKHFLAVRAAYFTRRRQQFCLIGDYNIPDIKWQPVYMPEYSEEYIAIASKLLGYCIMMNVIQYNRIYNKNDRILDLVLSNKRCYVRRAPIPLVKEDTHHPALIINIRNDDDEEEEEESEDSDDEIKYESIRQKLTEIQWYKLFTKYSAKEIVGVIEEYMEELSNGLRRDERKILISVSKEIVKRFERYLSKVKIVKVEKPSSSSSPESSSASSSEQQRMLLDALSTVNPMMGLVASSIMGNDPSRAAEEYARQQATSTAASAIAGLFFGGLGGGGGKF